MQPRTSPAQRPRRPKSIAASRPPPGSHVPVPPVPSGVAVLSSRPLAVMASTSAASRLPQPGCLGRVTGPGQCPAGNAFGACLATTCYLRPATMQAVTAQNVSSESDKAAQSSAAQLNIGGYARARGLVSTHSPCSGCSSSPAGASPHSPAAGSSYSEVVNSGYPVPAGRIPVGLLLRQQVQRPRST